MPETHFQQELEKLEVAIMKMFTLTEQSLNKAITAMRERDDDKAQEVIEEDEQLNQLEVEVDDITLHILALWQPVAKDLRFITGCSRIATNLERIGDQATNICERVLMLNQKPRLSLMNSVEALADKALTMFRNVTSAFSDQDSKSAMLVCRTDSEVDDMNIRLMRSLIDFMITENVIVERAVHSIIISNALERVGDLSTNIGEDVVFISRGINLKHCDTYDNISI
ncbi:MAG: phosphate signaling complex protein PhoU [Desulfohalobiaceae bacterium]|nr:phosphate signaling complex protein PhoU [Desulfohalobiaceae bacterium]